MQCRHRREKRGLAGHTVHYAAAVLHDACHRHDGFAAISPLLAAHEEDQAAGSDGPAKVGLLVHYISQQGEKKGPPEH